MLKEFKSADLIPSGYPPAGELKEMKEEREPSTIWRSVTTFRLTFLPSRRPICSGSTPSFLRSSGCLRIGRRRRRGKGRCPFFGAPYLPRLRFFFGSLGRRCPDGSRRMSGLAEGKKKKRGRRGSSPPRRASPVLSSSSSSLSVGGDLGDRPPRRRPESRGKERKREKKREEEAPRRRPRPGSGRRAYP